MFFMNGKNIFEEDVIHYVEGVLTGEFSIPAFQREYAWGNKPKKILDCLDSIYRGFNLGSIIFWESQFSSISRKEQNIHSNNEGNIFYVVDGQQRTLTLVSLFSENNVVDLDDRNIFIYLDEKTKKLKFQMNRPSQKLMISLNAFKAKILTKPKGYYDFKDDASYVEAMTFDYDLFNVFKAELATFKYQLVSKKLIIGYKLQITPRDLNEAIVQFEKINAAGIKLSEFNILDAVAYSDNRYSLSSMTKGFKNVNFQGILTVSNKFTSDMIKVILNSYKLIKNYRDSLDDDERKYTLSADAISNFKSGDSKIFDDIFKRFKDFAGTVKQLGLSGLKDVPYTPNVTLYIFMKELYKNGFPNLSDSDFIYRTMFWTGIQKSYDKSASAQLIKHIKLIELQLAASEPLYIAENNLVGVSSSDLRNTSYKSIGAMEKAIFIYQINQLKPLDYLTNKEVKLDGIFSKAKNLDHIFPKAKYSDKNFPEVNSLVNIALSFAKTNKEKSDNLPSHFFASLAYAKNFEMYDSHSITQDAYKDLIDDQFESFLSNRADAMVSDINEHIEYLKTTL